LLAASNAAADAPPATAAPDARSAEGATASSRSIVRLLWADAAAAPRLRSTMPFRRIVTALDLAPDAPEVDEDEPEERRGARHVHEVLVGGDPLDRAGIDAAVDAASGARGKFEPPLVVVAGELELPMDEVEEMTAALAAMAPLGGGDKKLEEVIDATRRLLAVPRAALRLYEMARRTYAQGKRPVALEELDAWIKRDLLDRRRYARRSVVGKIWVRGVLRLPRGDELAFLLPEIAGAELPREHRFEVRAIGEIDLAQDADEADAYVFRALALGYVAPRRAAQGRRVA
jgi:hypothetical protein